VKYVIVDTFTPKRVDNQMHQQN